MNLIQERIDGELLSTSEEYTILAVLEHDESFYIKLLEEEEAYTARCKAQYELEQEMLHDYYSDKGEHDAQWDY